MKRGEIWTVSASGFVGKPRPALVVQNDAFDRTNSVTMCAFTSDDTVAVPARLLVQPTPGNGLVQPSQLMVDKISTVPRNKVGRRTGRLDESDQVRADEAIALFLGLA